VVLGYVGSLSNPIEKVWVQRLTFLGALSHVNDLWLPFWNITEKIKGQRIQHQPLRHFI